MAVYTKLSKRDAKDILKEYGFKKVHKIEGISEGILNTNYLIEGDRGKFVLRILEGDREKEEEEKELSLLRSLYNNGFPCSYPLYTDNGTPFITYKGKLLSLFSFVEGDKPKEITSNEVSEIGTSLAKFHLHSHGHSIKRLRMIDMDYFYRKIEDAPLKEILGEDYESLIDYYNYSTQIDYSHLPSGIIHNDIFPDNVFFKNGKISGLIDFNDSMNGPFIFDIAIIINYWIRYRVEDNNVQEMLIETLLEAYNRVRPISSEELKLLDEAILRSILTFIFLRINKFHVEDTVGVQMEKKDHRDLIRLLDYFNNKPVEDRYEVY